MSFKNILTEKVMNAFCEAGYDKEYGVVSISKRPDLCRYQCNGCMPLAKIHREKPIDIANKIAEILKKDPAFKNVNPCMPGFLNIDVSDEFLVDYIKKMAESETFLFEKGEKKTAVIDYGGANVAKSLHVGHLRSAIIGEAIKRILKFCGYDAYGDVHLGDWGLQMGMVICGIIEQFGIENLQTKEDREKHITIGVLEKTYPAKSKEAKENEDVMAECKRITFELQKGEGIYFDIWETVLAVSKADLKKNYSRLLVDFEIWKGESDVRDIMPPMIKKLKDEGFAHIDDGALVIDITDENDNPPLPPFILEKSDGAVLYSTTDLATIIMRTDELDPELILYVVDNRQGMHFKQLFKTAAKTGIADKKLQLEFAGFGTMNGSDGKPYKTREGGVMRLEDLINTIEEEAYKKVSSSLSENTDEETMREIAKKVGMGALKFADLSNHRSKDYIFDVEKFCSFEGKTGPYVQYSGVRIKSILEKASESADFNSIMLPEGDTQRDLFILITEFETAIKAAADDFAPNVLVEYIYNLCVSVNKFYHEYKVLNEEDSAKRLSRISVLAFTLRLLTAMLDIIGIELPDRM